MSNILLSQGHYLSVLMVRYLASLLCSALTAVLPEEINPHLPAYICMYMLTIYGNIYVFINLCVCVYISLCICKLLYTYVYVYIYKHRYINT